MSLLWLRTARAVLSLELFCGLELAGLSSCGAQAQLSCSMWVSSQTKDQTYTGRQFLNHWTIREASSSFIFIYLMCFLMRVTYDGEMDTEISGTDGAFQEITYRESPRNGGQCDCQKKIFLNDLLGQTHSAKYNLIENMPQKLFMNRT